MTRIVRIDVEYCILLTPARSAAAYAHQVHRKAMIVGLKIISHNKLPLSKISFATELIPGLAMTNEELCHSTLSAIEVRNDISDFASDLHPLTSDH